MLQDHEAFPRNKQVTWQEGTWVNEPCSANRCDNFAMSVSTCRKVRWSDTRPFRRLSLAHSALPTFLTRLAPCRYRRPPARREDQRDYCNHQSATSGKEARPCHQRNPKCRKWQVVARGCRGVVGGRHSATFFGYCSIFVVDDAWSFSTHQNNGLVAVVDPVFLFLACRTCKLLRITKKSFSTMSSNYRNFSGLSNAQGAIGI